MAADPYADSSGWSAVPQLTSGMSFRDYGSYGLRQYSGWVREEFLPELVGRNGAGVYREMADNNPTIGAILFAIKQAVREIEWRVEAASDKPEAKAEAEFVESLMSDMSHTWDDFVVEALSMLQYGYAPLEIVYKRRHGDRPESRPGPKPSKDMPSSKFTDGRIGWRRLPLRGQDTVIKWFFDDNGQVRGLTQQPWVGQLIDIPIEKMLLFRPTLHKNNPEGYSILRTSYRPYYFTKRLEEQEAIMVERFNGLPVIYIPNEVIEKAAAGDKIAMKALDAYKQIVTNLRIDEQMGAVLPSDVYVDPSTGKPTATRMYQLELVTPNSGGKAGGGDADKIISRYKLDMMMTVLADFIQLGHEVRGTNNLAVTKVDMFYSAVQGWSGSVADVLNRYGIPRIWRMNRLDRDLMPELHPDLPQRLDLDGLGGFVANMAAAGMPLFPDDELQEFLREAAGMPEMTSKDAVALAQRGGTDAVKKMLLGAMARKIKKMREEKVAA
jgi:hypothetical protein